MKVLCRPEAFALAYIYYSLSCCADFSMGFEVPSVLSAFLKENVFFCSPWPICKVLAASSSLFFLSASLASFSSLVRIVGFRLESLA
jgi:hypothetical protein